MQFFSCFLESALQSNTATIIILLLLMSFLLILFTQFEEIIIQEINFVIFKVGPLNWSRPYILPKKMVTGSLLLIIVLLITVILLLLPFIGKCSTGDCINKLTIVGSKTMGSNVINDKKYFANNCKICKDEKTQYEPTSKDEKIQYEPTSSGVGISKIAALSPENSKHFIAASSKRLTQDEKDNLGLVEYYIGQDDIAVFITKSNPFYDILTDDKKGITLDELKKIYRGDIVDYSQIESIRSHKITLTNNTKVASKIKIISLIGDSGTRTEFDKIVTDNNKKPLSEKIDFQSDSVNSWIYNKSVMTDYSIAYAGSKLISSLRDISSISIDKHKPNSAGYPITRPLSYVYKKPLSGDSFLFIDCIKKQR